MPDPSREGPPRAVAGLIANLIVPGAGSLLTGRTTSGALQLALFLCSALMNLSGTLAVVGLPLWLAVWLWALLTSIAASRPPE